MPARWSGLCLQNEAADGLVLLLHAWEGTLECVPLHPFPSFLQHLLGTCSVPGFVVGPWGYSSNLQISYRLAE